MSFRTPPISCLLPAGRKSFGIDRVISHMRARGASGDEIERENDKQMHIPSLSHFLLVFLTILSQYHIHKSAYYYIMFR